MVVPIRFQLKASETAFTLDPVGTIKEGSDPARVIKLIVAAFTLESDLALIHLSRALLNGSFVTASVKGQLKKVIDYAHMCTWTRTLSR